MTVVAIHQPNFLPWLGYFVKIARSDVFVFLDTVQFSSGSFSNRVKIRHADGQIAWLTLPVASESKVKPLNQVKPFKKEWRTDILNRLSNYYARASHFTTIMPIIEQWLRQAPDDNLSSLNEHLIVNATDLLGYKTQWRTAAELGLNNLKLNDLNVAIVKAVGGDVYLSGTGGARTFNDAQIFVTQNIKLVYNEAILPRYEQPSDGFIENLSLVDALYNVGVQGTADLISEAIRSAPPI